MSGEKKICLYCRKEISSENPIELKNLWHPKCIQKFFGTVDFPEISVTKEQLENLALETVSKGYTVAGVQKKLSLHLSQEKKSRLTIVGYPAGFILKPQTEEFAHLPEMENLVMNIAASAGIKTVPNALVRLYDGFAYITRRIDRKALKSGTKLFAMEDFCQLSERPTEDKYKSSYERCAKIIRTYSSKPGLDIAELFYRLVFCFATGNSDMHLKNFSLIESEPKSRCFELSAAYDLLPVNLAMPEDTEDFALTMNGKKSKIKRHDFLMFADTCKISESAAEKIIHKIISLEGMFKKLVAESFLSESEKSDFIKLIASRMERLRE
ncbi:MAG: HipA domain-containing protein [Treponema sp.]|nr:HipA domain-containing protein [Treponema sp.]